MALSLGNVADIALPAADDDSLPSKRKRHLDDDLNDTAGMQARKRLSPVREGGEEGMVEEEFDDEHAYLEGYEDDDDE